MESSIHQYTESIYKWKILSKFFLTISEIHRSIWMSFSHYFTLILIVAKLLISRYKLWPGVPQHPGVSLLSPDWGSSGETSCWSPSLRDPANPAVSWLQSCLQLSGEPAVAAQLGQNKVGFWFLFIKKDEWSDSAECWWWAATWTWPSPPWGSTGWSEASPGSELHSSDRRRPDYSGSEAE